MTTSVNAILKASEIVPMRFPALKILITLLQHTSCSMKILKKASVVMFNISDNRNQVMTAVEDTLSVILANDNFDVNDPLNENGHTAAHMSAIKRKFITLRSLCKLNEFDPCIEDTSGNRFTYYLVDSSIRLSETVLPLLDTISPNGDIINAPVNSRGQTLAHCYGQISYTAAMKQICQLETFNPNVRNAVGETVLIQLMKQKIDKSTLAMSKALLSAHNPETSAKNEDGLTAIDYVIKQLDDPSTDIAVALNVLQLTVQAQKTTSELIHTAFPNLLSWAPPPGHISLYIDTIDSLLRHNGFSIYNCQIHCDAMQKTVRLLIERVHPSVNVSATVVGILNQLCEHASCQFDTLRDIFLSLVEIRDSGLGNHTMMQIANREEFNVNATMNQEGQRMAHICAVKKNVEVLSHVCKLPSFNPHVTDNFNNTFLQCEELEWYLSYLLPFMNKPNSGYNVNTAVTHNKQTIAHLFMQQRNEEALQTICGLDEFDPNMQDTYGKTALFYNWEEYLDESTLSMAAMILDTNRMDVCIQDDTNTTVTEHFLTNCSIENLTEAEVVIALKLVRNIIQHSSMTASIAQSCFVKLLQWSPEDKHATLHMEVLAKTIACPGFNANRCEIETDLIRKKTDNILGHLESWEENHVLVLKSLLSHTQCDSEILSSTILTLLPKRKHLTSLIVDTIFVTIFNNINFEVHANLTKKGETIGHLCAKEQAANLLKKVYQLPSFNPNKQDIAGKTALFYYCDLPFPHDKIGTLEELLAHSQTDVSLCDINNMTTIDHCIKLLNEPDIQHQVGLGLIEVLLKHPSATADLACNSFTKLLAWSPPTKLDRIYIDVLGAIMGKTDFNIDKCNIQTDKLVNVIIVCCRYIKESDNARHIITSLCDTTNTDVLRSLTTHILDQYTESLTGRITQFMMRIVRNSSYDINSIINNEVQTMAHVCAKKNMTTVLRSICECRSFKPNLQDSQGRTVLFDIVENLSVQNAAPFVIDMRINWNFRLTDGIDGSGQTVLNFYSKLENKDEYILELLKTASFGRPQPG